MEEKTIFIDSIRGKVINEKNLKVSKNGNLVLNSEGGELPISNDGVIQNLEKEKEVFIFPKVFTSNFDLQANEANDSFYQIASDIQQKWKAFEIKEADKKIEVIKEKKIKENHFLNQFYKQATQQLEKANSYSNSFLYQCKGLNALILNVKLVELKKFYLFLKDVNGCYQNFSEQRSELKKKTGENIFNDLVIKPIDDSLSFTSGKNKKKVAVKSLTDFIDFGGNEKNKLKILEDNFKRIKVYEEEVGRSIQILGILYQCIVKKLKKAEKDEFLKSVYSLTNDPKEDNEFTKYKNQISEDIQSLKVDIDQHSENLQRLQKVKVMDNTLNNILMAMNMNDYVQRLKSIDKRITFQLISCWELKSGKDNMFKYYFKVLLGDRQKLHFQRLHQKGSILELSNKIINNSLKQLLFAQNLPKVYDNCLDELLRRIRFFDALKREYSKINNNLSKIYLVEREYRENFRKENEELLGGYSIPPNLVLGIGDSVQETRLTVTENLPDSHTINNILDDDWEVLDLDEDDEQNISSMEEIMNPKIEVGKTVLVEQRSKKAAESITIEDVYQRLFPSNTENDTSKQNSGPKRTQLPSEEGNAKFNPHLKKVIALECQIKKIQRENKNLKVDKSRLEKFNKEIKEKFLHQKDQIDSQISQMKLQFNNEKNELVKLNTSYKVKLEKLQKEYQDQVLKNTKLLKNARNARNEKKDDQENIERIKSIEDQLKKAWDEKGKLENQLTIERKKFGDAKKHYHEEIFKKEKECKQRLIQMQNELSKAKKNVKGFQEVMNPMLKRNDQLDAKVKTLETQEKNLKNIISRKEVDIKKLEVNKRAFEVVMNKKKEFQAIIIKQTERIQTLEKEKQHLMKKNASLGETPEKKYEKKIEVLMKMGFSKENSLVKLMTHKGDLRKAVADLTKPLTNTQIQINVPKNFICCYDFKEKDRVLFFKSKKNPNLWEIFDWKNMAKKKRNIYLHPNVTRELDKKSTTCSGCIWTLYDINPAIENPLNLKDPHRLVVMSIDDQF